MSKNWLSDGKRTVAHSTAAQLADVAVDLLASGASVDAVTDAIWITMFREAGGDGEHPEALPFANAVLAAAVAQLAVERRAGAR